LTLALLDTNAYLRLAKRIKPMLGVKFGQKEYELTIPKVVEEEVHRSSRLRFLYPWFDDDEQAAERLAKQVRLSKDEKAQLLAATSILHNHVLNNAACYITKGRSPPSNTDCYILAFGQIRPAIVVTDDLGMHKLAREFAIPVWHGHELLRKMLSAKLISNDHVREIYQALEANDDLPQTWRVARHVAFKKIFGPPV
jgi:predicted nucleic acid-binding protein